MTQFHVAGLSFVYAQRFRNGHNTLSLWPNHLWHFNCLTHQNTHSDREALWCHSLACYAFRHAVHCIYNWRQLSLRRWRVACVGLDLLRPWPTQIPPHLGCLTISQRGSVEFLCNSHASPVFSKHCESMCLCGWPISVGSIKLFLLSIA